jgi:hypothetical protein
MTRSWQRTFIPGLQIGVIGLALLFLDSGDVPLVIGTGLVTALVFLVYQLDRPALAVD